MGVEIERRFLVRDAAAALQAARLKCRIRQGYFGSVGGLQIRLRISALGSRSTAALTLKSSRRGLCRLEYEYRIPIALAERALALLPPAEIIRKDRYEIKANGLSWSIDNFHGPNSGLLLAEVELTHPRQVLDLPDWLGAEITNNRRFGNSTLARFPVLGLQLTA